jgi:DNA-directed RNA polymerase subunit M/transcription elongation factor TFIIS
MSNCLNCGKILVSTEGKREKKFCNSTCRSNYWQKEKVKMKATKKTFKVAKTEPKGKKNTCVNPTFKTLEELKAACPKELNGVDKGAWISENRVKFNI